MSYIYIALIRYIVRIILLLALVYRSLEKIEKLSARTWKESFYSFFFAAVFPYRIFRNNNWHIEGELWKTFFDNNGKSRKLRNFFGSLNTFLWRLGKIYLHYWNWIKMVPNLTLYDQCLIGKTEQVWSLLTTHFSTKFSIFQMYRNFTKIQNLAKISRESKILNKFSKIELLKIRV